VVFSFWGEGGEFGGGGVRRRVGVANSTMLFVNHFKIKPHVMWYSLWPAYLCPWSNRTVSSVLVVTIQSLTVDYITKAK